MVDVQQPRPTEPMTRSGSPTSNYLGVHKQPQEGRSRVGVHVPVGRLSVAEARHIADLADKYSGGEIRLTVEQNVILPNVEDAHVAQLLAEPALNGDSRLSVHPGNIVGNLVSCTGAQFCGLALIETKNNAERIAAEVEKRVDVDRDVRIHWTGCPNSCGQAQAGDIGLMGGPAKKKNAEGVMKAVPGVKIFVGGTIGEDGKLQLDAEVYSPRGSTQEQPPAHHSALLLMWSMLSSPPPFEPRCGQPDSVPIEDLVPHLTETIVDSFGGKLKPGYEAEQQAFREEMAALKAEQAAAAAAKAAKTKEAA